MKIEKVVTATIKRALGCERYALSNQGIGSHDKGYSGQKHAKHTYFTRRNHNEKNHTEHRKQDRRSYRDVKHRTAPLHS